MWTSTLWGGPSSWGYEFPRFGVAARVGDMDSHTACVALFRVFLGKLVKGRFPLQKIKSNHPAITVPKPKPVCAQT